MPQKTLNLSHYSTTIQTTNNGITLTSTGSHVHRLDIHDLGGAPGQAPVYRGEERIDPHTSRQLPEIDDNTIYKIELLTTGLGGDVIIDY